MEKIEQRQLKSNIWKFYIYMIIKNLFFFGPIIILFWQDNGLDLIQIMVLQSLFSIALVVLEVPTGYFADIFGRKNSLMLSGLFTTIALGAYSLGHNFYQFLIAEMIWAVGVSLISGTDSAFIYDTLIKLKRN